MTIPVKAKAMLVQPVKTSVGMLLVLISLLEANCITRSPQPVAKKDMEELDRLKPRSILDDAKVKADPGPPPFREKVSPFTKELVLPTKLFSMLFSKAALGEVLGALTKDADYNISVESEVDLSKSITVNLKNVTLEEALDIIVVNGAGYTWQVDRGTLAIKRFVERIYHFDTLDIVSQTEVDVGGDMLGSGVQNAGVTGKYQVKAKKSEQGSDIWLAVEQALGGLKSEEGSLRINRAAGVIYIADAPRKVAAMVKFLDSLSESLRRQVLVEARIMEVTLTDETKLGIDWTKWNISFRSNNSLLPDVFELGVNGGASIQRSSTTGFSALLDFLRTQGEVKVLSNPHLTVMNRQSAVFTVGYQFPYADVDGVDRDKTTGMITIGTSIRRAILGLQMGLTAQIDKDGMITFHIVPTLTRIQREVDVEIPLGLTKASISNPVIDLQELATTVRVQEGNSFVLAGLISKIRNIQHKGLPLLGDLPLVGGFFKHQVQSEANSELVIFITPYIRNEKVGSLEQKSFL
jgi:MSHA biogenesis protein MshL